MLPGEVRSAYDILGYGLRRDEEHQLIAHLQIQPRPEQREGFGSCYPGYLTGKYQASSDYLKLYLVFKMLQSPLNSDGVAADQVPGPPLICTPSHDSKPR